MNGLRMLVLLALLAAPAVAQDAPRLSRADWILLGADAGVRALDVYSTHRMLERGNRELFLPEAIAGNTPAMAAYSGGCVAAEFLLMRWLERRGHHRLALLVPAIDIAQAAPWAIRNLTLPDQRAPRVTLRLNWNGGRR